MRRNRLNERRSLGKEFSIIQHLLKNTDDGNFQPRPASEATDAPPGTKEKIEVMAARVWIGEDLHHPNDRVDCTGFTGLMIGIQRKRRD